jgi:hypothetical protein
MRTFVSHHIQPLRWWEAAVWLYLGPSCSDRSFSAELDIAEIDTWIHRILTLGAHWNSGPNPIPLREGIVSPWVSPLELVPI